jgi:hypothetical protein
MIRQKAKEANLAMFKVGADNEKTKSDLLRNALKTEGSIK